MVMEPLAVFTAPSIQPAASLSRKHRSGLYAVSVSGGSPIKITDHGQQIYEGIYGGWETLAAAEIDGVNTVLWKHKAANRLHTWSLDSNWEHISSDGWIDPNSGDAIAFETNFKLDLNGDGTIGSAYSTVHTAGSIAFRKHGRLGSLCRLCQWWQPHQDHR